MMASTPSAHHPPGGRPPGAARLALVGFFAVAGFFLLTEHRAHVFGALPYLLLLACPLLHLFMHRGHRHGGDDP
jgi:hypothetical protein